jgi:hypothetical protein
MINRRNHLNSKNGLKIDLLLSLFFGLLVAITRIPFISKYLYEWDSVNFALALENYNIAIHQPQPPGYILFVALGRVVNTAFHDANLSLIFLSILFSILTVILLYFLAKQIFSRKVGIISSILLIFSPIFWFYGEITTIYPSEAFLAILIAFTSYQVLKGNQKFFYVSALILGLAGGFRQDLILFMFPLWLFCLWYSDNNYKRILKAFTVLVASVLLWLIPTIMLANGIGPYLSASQHFSGSFQTSSVLFGAPLSNHLLLDGMLFSWLILGLGFLGALFLIIFVFKKGNAIINRELLKNFNFIFLALWILPAFLFQVLIPLSKPGYILVYLAALILIVGYIIWTFSKEISLRFWDINHKFDISADSVFIIILILYIFINSVYFFYPYNLNEETTWETQISNMNYSQKIILGIDLSSMYNNEKIVINDQNMDLHINNIMNLSNFNPNSTQIVIRDIVREDQGFSWRKAMYYLPQYDVYYLFDSENSQLKGAKMKDNVSYSYGKMHLGSGAEGKDLEIPIQPSTTKIVWIMDDKSQFYKELQSQIEIKTIRLPNGLNIYYSDVENRTVPFKVGGFIFKPMVS